MNRITISLAVSLAAMCPPAFAQGKACDLVTPEELQATLGAKPRLSGSTLPNGVEVCTGKAGGSTITIRFHQKKDDTEREREEEKLDKLRTAGVIIENRRVGGFNCTELRPSGKATRQPYTTSCATAATSRLPKYAVVEVSNPSQSMEMKQLVPLVQGIAGRIY